MELKPEIEQLLQQKSFEALTEAERAKVSMYFTKEEYDQIYALFKATKGTEADIPDVPETLFHELEEVFYEKQKNFAVSSGYFKKIQLPLWQTIALMFIAFIAGSWLFRQDKIIVEEKVKIIHQRDTVFIDKPIMIEPTPKSEVVPKPKLKRSKPKQSDEKRQLPPIAAVNQDSNPGGNFNKQRANEEIMSIAKIELTPPKGRSAKDDEKLMKFLVKVY